MPAPRVGKSQGGVLVVWERGGPRDRLRCSPPAWRPPGLVRSQVCVASVPRAGLCVPSDTGAAGSCQGCRASGGGGRQGPRMTRSVGQGRNCGVVRIPQIVECGGGGRAAEGAREAGRKLLQEPRREAGMISTNTDSWDGENKGGFEIF